MTKRKSIKAQTMNDSPHINSIFVHGTRFIGNDNRYHDHFGIVLNRKLNERKNYFLAVSNFVYGLDDDEKHSYTRDQLKRALIVNEANNIGIHDAYAMDNDSLIPLIFQKYNEFEMSLNDVYEQRYNYDDAHPMTEGEYREYWNELLRN